MTNKKDSKDIKDVKESKDSKYYIITKQKQLRNYIESIKSEKVLFIDTEFHRELLKIRNYSRFKAVVFHLR